MSAREETHMSEDELREIFEHIGWWGQLTAIWYLRWLLLKQRALVWLHRSRLALDLTYRQIERGGG